MLDCKYLTPTSRAPDLRIVLYCVCNLAVRSIPRAFITARVVFSVGLPRSLNDL